MLTFAVPVLDFTHKNDVAASKCYTVFLKCNTSMKPNIVFSDIVNHDNNFDTYRPVKNQQMQTNDFNFKCSNHSL